MMQLRAYRRRLYRLTERLRQVVATKDLTTVAATSICLGQRNFMNNEDTVSALCVIGPCVCYK